MLNQYQAPKAAYGLVFAKRLCQALIFIGLLGSRASFGSPCEPGETAHIWLSPRTISPGTAVKIMAVSGSQAIGELVLTDPNGGKISLNAAANNGMPWRLSARIDALGEGRYRLEAKDKGKVLACRELFIGDNREAGRAVWNAGYEAFYAAWIEQLFDSPAEESLSFPTLEPVLRDANRNFLYDYLGMYEDRALPAMPDCADLPYFLRSYFAWKNGLPFSYRGCGRGTAQKPPVCASPVIRTEFETNNASLAAFKSVSHSLLDAVQSGNGRTALSSDATDFYPVPLQRETLWPGTIYADPYGHVLVLAKWVAQTPASPGILFAVDAQPDHSVTRKRFWEGTFLFANSANAGPGFKAFRPLSPSRSLVNNGQLPNFSIEQAELSPDDFYARMYKLINPNGLDPSQAYQATLTALVEQLKARLQSVENGENYFRKNAGVIGMPSGPAIFETIGPWEDFATPSRDMRLLIAMNVLLDFPDKIVRHPELFNLNADAAAEAKTRIQRLHETSIAGQKIQYVRSNGSPWELSVAEILARKPAFEMAYNPNDCVEIRWGAAAGTEEYASCKRHAPVAQVNQMAAARNWFHETKRPTR